MRVFEISSVGKAYFSPEQAELYLKLGKALEASYIPTVEWWDVTMTPWATLDDGRIIALITERVPSWVELDPDGQKRSFRFAFATSDGWALSRSWRPEWDGWNLLLEETTETEESISFIISRYRPGSCRRESISVDKKDFRSFDQA